ncbi:MAG TPA: KH domain-containing protein [Bacilli bacterium]|nr:KH domain-containing protein [Bacilli bacterium]
MNLVELTEYLVKSLVKDSDNVSVKQFETEDDTILIQVLVSSDVVGAVIGKGGRIANAIRTIVQASSYMGENKRVKINIDSF